MGTLREEAEKFEPPMVLNIADLELVNIDDVEIKEETGKDSDGKEFTYKFFEFEGKKYRVPNPVFEELQKMIRLKPDLKKIKVKKTGEGYRTRYNVDIVL